MAEAFATYFCLGDFDATLIANHATVLHAFVLSAEALPISYRSEDSCTEKSVTLGFERAVIYCFGFGHLTMRPLPDLFR